MTVNVRKYNPSFLSEDELVASFCVRTSEFESITQALRESPETPSTHQLLIGPRGSGKTSLLLRVAAELRRDAGLSSRFFPILFAEESYEVASAGEFWLECVSRLANQAPNDEDSPGLDRTYEELRNIEDDQILGERCLATLLDFSDRVDKRLVVMVENLNMMFDDMGDSNAGWRLRKVLQIEPRITLLASATSRFDEIDKPENALYEMFRVLVLRPLDINECAVLWMTVAGKRRAPETIRALRILTGGSPRLLTIVARFGAKLSFRQLMADLLDLVDDHTEYFKSHLEALPSQERRVYLALAHLWKPATTREIAHRARINPSKCSAQLNRLVARGVVEFAGGTAWRKKYYLTERLYNIYYLIRRSGQPTRLIEAFVQFMEAYYSPSELNDIAAQILRDSHTLNTAMQSLSKAAFARLIASPTLAPYRQELLSLAPGDFEFAEDPFTYADSLEKGARSTKIAVRAKEVLSNCDVVLERYGESKKPEDLINVAKALLRKGMALVHLKRHGEALAAWESVIQQFQDSRSPALHEFIAKALVNKSAALFEVNRSEEAIGACDKVVRRFGNSDSLTIRTAVAVALTNKGAKLYELSHPKEALAVFDEIIDRFGSSDELELIKNVALASANRTFALGMLNGLDEAVEACDAVLLRFGKSQETEIETAVAKTIVKKGVFLHELNRSEEAIAVWDELVQRFEDRKDSAVQEEIAIALTNKGAVLTELQLPEEGIISCDEVVKRYGERNEPELLVVVARALATKGAALGTMKRHEEAVTVLDEVLRRFGENDELEFPAVITGASINRGNALLELQRPEEASQAFDEVVQFFEQSGDPQLNEDLAAALVKKGYALVQLERRSEALEIWAQFLQRFSSNDEPAYQGMVARIFVNKGALLFELNRPEEALSDWNEVVDRFGESEELKVQDAVIQSLVNKGTALITMNRLKEGMAAWDEIVGRFGDTDNMAHLEVVATILHEKGAILSKLGHSTEAIAVWSKVVRRYSIIQAPEVLEHVARAQLSTAELQIKQSQYSAALEVMDRLLQAGNEITAENRWRGRLIRAWARILSGNPVGGAEDIEDAIEDFPDPGLLGREDIGLLLALGVELGPERMLALINTSNVRDYLLPLITALEQELGIESEVSREVMDVAKDIQKEMADLLRQRDHS